MSDSTAIQKFADAAMYKAEAMPSLSPQVHLIQATPDPLGSIAAACSMYEGIVVRDKSEITDEKRRQYWEQVRKTHLKAPLEFVNVHFLIEGVSRAFTHQLVRQRTAVYAQESMRFAVKENMAEEVPLPPSIEPGSFADTAWKDCLDRIQEAYDELINRGIPAEDARGLLPHATTTRVHYHTNLRNLLDHAGNRLCTQAQFEWRSVFTGISNALSAEWGWQGELISELFRPVCYQLGKCPFKAQFDRGCTIREKVDELEEEGVPTQEWDRHIPAVEWLMFADSARVKPGDKYGDQSHRL